MKLSFFLFLGCLFLIWSCKPDPAHLFELTDPDKTGVAFVNKITESDSMNIIEYTNIYNGGGVAVGDLNQDGLPDLFFGGNMVSSKLYLNKSKTDQLAFTDVTEAAGITTGQWITGVTMVDINQDGLLDIYACASGSKNAKKRENKLFINQGLKNGIPQFKESAAEYGLNDDSYTTQAAFFDYDRDGDLDVFLIVNVAGDYFSGKVNQPDLRRHNPDPARANKLYQNTAAERAAGAYSGTEKFINVSKAAGIKEIGYNLGLCISDLNKDGWPDIYIVSDFLPNDVIYLNNQNGTFTNKASDYVKHTSYAGMGVDIADFNNDQLTDIAVVDMIPEDNKRMKAMLTGMNYDRFMMNVRHGYYPQFSRNTLQLNNGQNLQKQVSFSEISPMAGIHHTDWSWSVLFADYDNDGWKDIYITNGFLRDMQDLDFVKYGLATAFRDDNEDKKRVLQLFKNLPEVKVPNYLYQNQKNLTFRNVTEPWGLQQPSVSSGAIYADLDNDGDLDLVVSNLNEPASIYKNKLSSRPEKPNFLKINFLGPESNRDGIGAQVEVKTLPHAQFYENFITRGFQSSIQSLLHVGLGRHRQVDELKITWPDGKVQTLKNIQANRTLTLRYQDASDPIALPTTPEKTLLTQVNDLYNLQYRHQENDYNDFNIHRLLPFKLSQSGPGLAVADIDGNGTDDFYVGGSMGNPGTIVKQNKNNSFQKAAFKEQALHEDMGALFFDADQDGDQDLYVVSGGVERRADDSFYTDRLYINDGKGNFTRSPQALPGFTTSGSCVAAADFDKDGDLDLFIGGRSIPNQYPLPASSKILINESKQKDKPVFTDATARILPALEKIGLVTSAIWTDYNNDSWVDLIIVGEGMPVTIFQNKGGKFHNNSALITNNAHGYWNSLVGEDFDQDGDIDYVIGNMGLNSLLKTSKKEPVCIYAKDFDKNGNIDPILCYYVLGQNVPFHPRDEFVDQMTTMRGTFTKYATYAQATLHDIFKPEVLKDAYVLRYETFGTSYLQNNGQQGFILKPLPMPAQMSPTYGMLAQDFDGDGISDLLLAGNSHAPSLTIGWYDASIGQILKGRGDGSFTPMPPSKTGFYADKDVRAVATLISADRKQMVLVSNNNDSLNLFQQHQPYTSLLPLQPMDAWAHITYTNGRVVKKEFAYGGGYLSQSSRNLLLNNKVKNVVIHDYAGNSRKVPLHNQSTTPPQ